MKRNEKETARQLWQGGKMTQKEIAQIVGVTEKTLSKWVREFKQPLELSNQLQDFLSKALADPKTDSTVIKSLVDSLSKLKSIQKHTGNAF